MSLPPLIEQMLFLIDYRCLKASNQLLKSSFRKTFMRGLMIRRSLVRLKRLIGGMNKMEFSITPKYYEIKIEPDGSIFYLN